MEETARLLIIDDDREIRDLLSRLLTQHGYAVVTGRDGKEMTAALAGSGKFDLVVLDVMLPGKSGLELCRELRNTSPIPILMLTAMGEETDRVVGLELGADDYLAKPFGPRELLARVRAMLRRSKITVAAAAPQNAKQLRFAGWRLDLGRRRLETPEGMLVGLTTGEFELLVAFAEHPQRVLTRDQLLDLSRGRDAAPFDRSVDVQVSRVRRKLADDPKAPGMIVTVRGDGYMFTPRVEVA